MDNFDNELIILEALGFEEEKEHDEKNHYCHYYSSRRQMAAKKKNKKIRVRLESLVWEGGGYGVLCLFSASTLPCSEHSTFRRNSPGHLRTKGTGLEM